LTGAKLIVEPSGAPPLPLANGRVRFSIEHRGERTTVALGGVSEQRYEMPRVSDGMAQNAALALAAALALGAAPDSLRLRLAAWRPAALRGEWRRINGRTLYLDCYNANPASMADALAAFCAAAPEAEPRLFVLGGMEELGAESDRYHRALGRSVRLRPSDLLFVIGAHAGAVLAGALEAGNRPDQIEVAESPEPAAARLAGFRGAVFLKGSRKYALERLAGEAGHA
jgi:UDP-N-acetylmuramyl pentapeptide synthase